MVYFLLLTTLVSLVSAVRWLPNSETVRGVNLGSQFIIEPWMAEDTWSEINCSCGKPDGCGDEWQCVKYLGQEIANARFEEHWSSWTTYDDIKEISSYGLNTIRIPIGFWIYNDVVHNDEFYPVGGLKHLDNIVGWAAELGLYVIIDLHGAPGSQSINQAFTGRVTKQPQFYSNENFERTYRFLEWMTEHIHKNEAYRSVGVLEVLNEPVRIWEDKEMADLLINTFYPEAYKRIRAKESSLNVAEEDALRVQYMNQAWGSGKASTNLPHDANKILFDAHVYYAFEPQWYSTKAELMTKVCQDRVRSENVIVGECSIGVRGDRNEFSLGPRTTNLDEQKDWFRGYWGTQAKSYEKAGGWIFWSWKCESREHNALWKWSYQSVVRQGIVDPVAANASGFSWQC